MARQAGDWAWAADVDERSEPHLQTPESAAIRPVERLEDHLATIVAGDYTVRRLTDLARQRFDEAADELTSADFRQFGAWLDERCGTTRGAARIKWRLVRDALDETISRRTSA